MDLALDTTSAPRCRAQHRPSAPRTAPTSCSWSIVVSPARQVQAGSHVAGHRMEARGEHENVREYELIGVVILGERYLLVVGRASGRTAAGGEWT